MKRIYRFIAGNSRVTPIGIAIALAAAFALRQHASWRAAAVYLILLVVTLAATCLEPVE